MNHDSLLSGTSRRSGFDDLLKGIEVVNAHLPLHIPLPARTRWELTILEQNMFEDPDQYYAELVCAIFDERPPATSGWTATLSRYGDLLGPNRPIEAIYDLITHGDNLDDGVLVRRAGEKIRVESVGLLDVITPSPFNYCKVNHSFWEYLTFIAWQRRGVPYFSTDDRSHPVRPEPL